MNLPFFIAGRYLFAKKSHNVINIISLISAVGIGIGSMALIIILSVYNGFDTLIKSFYEEYQPDFVISPVMGKRVDCADNKIVQIGSINGVDAVLPVVKESVFVEYGGREALATIYGVGGEYGDVSGIAGSLAEGEFKLMRGDIPHAAVGSGLAAELRLRSRFLTPLELYFPNPEVRFSAINPMASLNNETLYPSGVIDINQEINESGLYIPLATARELLSYSESEASYLEIYLDSMRRGEVSPDVERQILDLTGEEYEVKNRYQQNETLYKMMKAEKFAVYMILFFVIFIISVNIFGSLSMLIIDKRSDMLTYMSMGADEEFVRRIFMLQGWMISLMGAVAGILLGVVLSYLQMEFGIIKMQGNYIVDSYPVDIQFADILITFAGVALIGYLIAKIPAKFFKFPCNDSGTSCIL